MIGFEQPEYTVSESAGFVEVCTVFSEPESVQFESNIILTDIETVSDTATGIRVGIGGYILS